MVKRIIGKRSSASERKKVGVKPAAGHRQTFGVKGPKAFIIGGKSFRNHGGGGGSVPPSVHQSAASTAMRGHSTGGGSLEKQSRGNHKLFEAKSSSSRNASSRFNESMNN